MLFDDIRDKKIAYFSASVVAGNCTTQLNYQLKILSREMVIYLTFCFTIHQYIIDHTHLVCLDFSLSVDGGGML